MYYLGIDLGSSSVKIGLVDITSGKRIALVQQPKAEMSMKAVEKGWAEQNPEAWYQHVCNGIKELLAAQQLDATKILGIGMAYQMHGLVCLDRDGKVLRDAIIWCDSRAVDIGNTAYQAMGKVTCDERLLNAPGNFTASKLAWVKQNEPRLFAKVHKVMLPGDYIAYRLSGNINTTITGLSEGIFWDFQQNQVSEDVLGFFGFSPQLIPDIVPTFGIQGRVSQQGAKDSGLSVDTPICYRSGDQPNNALSLNVFNPGEIAATGGTSGVVYAVTDNVAVKETLRVNHFAHVNYNGTDCRNIGKLLCINGAGIQYRWLLNNLDVGSYEEMNELAATVPSGSDGLLVIPFGNGAERMLNNIEVGTQFVGLNLNRHTKAHLCRAALEGIAFAFVYGMEIMQEDGIHAKTMRAGNDNLFRSPLFANVIATLTNCTIEIYNITGAIGAARACILVEGDQAAFSAYTKNDHVITFEPGTKAPELINAYQNWKQQLEITIHKS
ncbi:Xylulose kinase [Croceitalea dokdonensis DOKDO 023]|uniref:Xylulose kinase n=1 Tax=Croceitalea dokdonensis DOKDO 023 TaxID=1300341 RepID=A0A0P7ARF0_9FLAO|nr:FGGY family carbohydrate kinase [Croceitalea dokdonensis]KPM30398.1 Xylulose kinase [Croceitalea dokdonensis DOKDO 023]